jgi:hypothetical protein
MITLKDDPDKERYLRLIDDLTFRELEYFIEFCRIATNDNLKDFIERGGKTGSALGTIAEVWLKREGRYTQEAHTRFTDEMVPSFQNLHFRGLLLSGRSWYHYDTTAVTGRFLLYILDPAELLRR